MLLQRVISGGQTGVDRIGLEVAKELGIPTGGWMPKGWKTEAGPMPGMREAFGMQEHQSLHYPDRTEANVVIADGTVWFGKDGAGKTCTVGAILRHDKQWICNPTANELAEWIEWKQVRVLNVAGNRASKLSPMEHANIAGILWGAFRQVLDAQDQGVSLLDGGGR